MRVNVSNAAFVGCTAQIASTDGMGRTFQYLILIIARGAAFVRLNALPKLSRW
jgi:hypothetical protein